MRIIDLNHFSNVLCRNKDIKIVMPDKINKKTKVILLLHGYCDKHDSWITKGDALNISEKHQVILIMPAAENSFYLDNTHGDKFFTYISEEVCDVCSETLNLNDNPWYIAGLSMGGFGSLRIGYLNDRFIKIGAFSSPLNPQKAYLKYDGDNELSIIELYKEKISKPVYLYCGEADGFYKENSEFYNNLKSNGYNVTFKSDSRGHEWPLWNDALDDFISTL